ncbi:beta family protein [Methylophaga sp.]|uniref:beta family protein n=1 Tax=Methylophaga sp. TaxID=2024840 RepID=UPI003A8FFC52
MFKDDDNFSYKYAPILSIKLAEMVALEELPEKDKEQILPIFLLRGWVSSYQLENSLKRIEKSIGQRYWVANIDKDFLNDTQGNKIQKPFPRPVHAEIDALLDPKNGYRNWYEFIKKTDKAIPSLLLGDTSQLHQQIDQLTTLNRGVVLLLTINELSDDSLLEVIITTIKQINYDDLYVVIDYQKIDYKVMSAIEVISTHIDKVVTLSPHFISISGSSFPDSFSREHEGEKPIYERHLFNAIKKKYPNLKMLYSDRGSARAEQLAGGSGAPVPRIDYPLENDWRFIRINPENTISLKEKNQLYTQIAQEMMVKDYWNENLHIWGTQMIEYTSKGDKIGIRSPAKATAVRINLHLHQQLCYELPEELIDTDEEWVD